MTKLVLVRGVSGSGKSTFAQKRAENEDLVHFETDMFFMVDGTYQYDASKIKEAHTWCQGQVRDNLSQGQSVVVSNTFTRMWEMEFYLNLVKELNVNLEVYVCVGEYKNVHNVPEEVVQVMRDRWEEFPGEVFVGEQFDREVHTWVDYEEDELFSCHYCDVTVPSGEEKTWKSIMEQSGTPSKVYCKSCYQNPDFVYIRRKDKEEAEEEIESWN